MPSMDAIITGLGDIRAAMGRDESRQDDAEIIQAAVSMIYALSEEGAKTTDDALDILHDYRLQANSTAPSSASMRSPESRFSKTASGIAPIATGGLPQIIPFATAAGRNWAGGDGGKCRPEKRNGGTFRAMKDGIKSAIGGGYVPSATHTTKASG